MDLRLVFSSILFMALATNPGFAKDSHAHHGAKASTSAASGKGGSSAYPAPSKANVPTDIGEAVAPPVLPPQGMTQHQFRITNPSAKSVINARHNQAGAMTSTTPAVRNAIGQPVVATKNFIGIQPNVSPAQRPFAGVSPAIVRPGNAHFNVATAANHGSINGATAIRSAIAPTGIGGPAQAHYGINGTTVQNRH